MHIVRTVEIDASPERVWSVMADVERWPAWTASVRSVELLEPGPLTEGSEARVSQPRFGTYTWRVTSVEPGRAFTWETRGAGVRMVATHAIEPRGADGSRVMLEVESSGPAVALLGWLLGRTGRRFVEMEAEGLKRRSEGG